MCSHSRDDVMSGIVLSHHHQPIYLESTESKNALNANVIKDARLSFLKRQWPKTCSRCQEQAARGVKPRAAWESERFSAFSHEDAQKITKPDGSIEQSFPKSLDVRFGNFCNLRCVMCFPAESSKWQRDYFEVFGEAIPDLLNYSADFVDQSSDFDWTKSSKDLEALIELSKEATHLHIGGGEPFINPRFRSYLRALIDMGRAAEIVIEVSTNLTVLPKSVIEQLGKFKQVRLCCSLDGIGLVNSQLRYPSKWESIVANLDQVDQLSEVFEVFTSTTLSLLNVEFYPEFLKWVEDKKFKNINKTFSGIGAYHWVHFPKWLSPSLLIENELDFLSQKLLNRMREAALSKKAEGRINKVLEDLKHIKKPVDKEQRNKFAKKFKLLSQNQKHEWESLFSFAAKVARATEREG